jgi:F0F1-type ATP synthase alpha subunit
MMLNQKTISESADKSLRLYWIYVVVGQKRYTVAQLPKVLRKSDCLKYTTVMAATDSDAAYTGCAMAEYFRDDGKHAVIFLDDLHMQAVAYRPMLLLLRRPPGREANPGDVPYLHSCPLERAVRMNETTYGGGSLIALPVPYIPTNVTLVTNGQNGDAMKFPEAPAHMGLTLWKQEIIVKHGEAEIVDHYLAPASLKDEIQNSMEFFYEADDMRFAVSVELFVIQVGSAAQIKAMKLVARNLKFEFAQHREMAVCAHLGSDTATQQQLLRGAILAELLTKSQVVPMTATEIIVLFWVGTQCYLDKVVTAEILRFQSLCFVHVNMTGGNILTEFMIKSRSLQ